MDIVYLNGEYLPKEQAHVSVEDRGFLFADGIYEVTPAYRGRFFRMERHLDRMERGLRALQIEYPLDAVPTIHDRLCAENGLGDEEVSIVYIQVSRGTAPRTHAFPVPSVPPTVFAFAKPFHRPSRDRWEEGFEAITIPDRRWAMVDIKSIALLPNVLAQQAAADAGVSDALLVKDGVALEGAHSNFFAVFGETVVTAPASNYILHGVTREFVIELARGLGYQVEERAVPVEQLGCASEAFFTGTTTEVKPTVRIDGRPVGNGSVGPVARALYEAFVAHTDAFALEGTGVAAGD